MQKLEQGLTGTLSRAILVRIAGGVDGTDTYPISVDSSGSILNRNMVYSSEFLAWVPMTQPGADISVGVVFSDTMDRIVERDAGQLELYVGMAAPGSLTSDPVWSICKITRDSNGNEIARKFASAGLDKSWDNRASYFP